MATQYAPLNSAVWMILIELVVHAHAW